MIELKHNIKKTIMYCIIFIIILLGVLCFRLCVNANTLEQNIYTLNSITNNYYKTSISDISKLIHEKSLSKNEELVRLIKEQLNVPVSFDTFNTTVNTLHKYNIDVSDKFVLYHLHELLYTSNKIYNDYKSNLTDSCTRYKRLLSTSPTKQILEFLEYPKININTNCP